MPAVTGNQIRGNSVVTRRETTWPTTSLKTPKGISLMKDRENEYLVFTADQQLYKIVIDIMFHKPSYFNTVVPVLGGMHMLMNFIHAISTIMAGSGLKEILASSFGSVDKMLSGKKYPQNFRALRMVVEELLRSLVQEEQFTSFTSMIQCLDQRASQKPNSPYVDRQPGQSDHHNDELFTRRPRS